MLRGLLLTACLFLLAGCSSPGSPAATAAGEAIPDDTQDATPDGQDAGAREGPGAQFTGQYDSLIVNGETVRSSGGQHTLSVDGAGWRDVVVRLDVHIETLLVLLPPGCGAATDACALRLEAPADELDVLATLPEMAPGEWTTALEMHDGGARVFRYGGSAYGLTFSPAAA